MDNNSIGKSGAAAIAASIVNNKRLQVLKLHGNAAINEESAMMIMRSLHSNNTITELMLSPTLCGNYSVRAEAESINNARSKSKLCRIKVCSIP